ncbi:MAG: hypothetical protein ACLU37_01010 [Collinsella sp.]
MVIAGKSDEEKVDLVEAPSVDEEETPAKSTSGVLNFFMGKTVYSAANPCASPLSMSSPVRRRAGTACTTKGVSISMSTLAVSCAPRRSRTATIRTCSTPLWKRLSSTGRRPSSRLHTA